VNICIRALDYCPPVDMQFGEFLRAVITADYDLVPGDPHGYRAEVIKACRLRGIRPADIRSYSEESLRWSPPEDPVAACKGLEYGILEGTDEAVASQRNKTNAVILNAFAKKNAVALGLDPASAIQVCSFHPVHRVSPSGRIIVDFVAEFLQTRKEPLNPDIKGSPQISFRGGSTVIFDHAGNVRYVIRKRIGDQSRLAKQRAFAMDTSDSCACSPYAAPPLEAQISFQAVHRRFF
jgi:hypothetical protein